MNTQIINTWIIYSFKKLVLIALNTKVTMGCYSGHVQRKRTHLSWGLKCRNAVGWYGESMELDKVFLWEWGISSVWSGWEEWHKGYRGWGKFWIAKNLHFAAPSMGISLMLPKSYKNKTGKHTNLTEEDHFFMVVPMESVEVIPYSP